MKKNAKKTGKRTKTLKPGKQLEKTKTLTTVSGPTESLSLNFTKIQHT